MTVKLETSSLSRVVGQDQIVDAVSQQVRSSDVIAIVGPSGAGKSSFLRLLNRLDEPTEGTVYLDGIDYRELDPQDVRRRIGLVPQDPALRSGTVADNVALGATIRDEPVDRDRISSLLDRMGLTGYEDRSVEDLSGGERQRVSIARTLYVEPEVLLLDEPTAHLDTATEERIEELLAELITDENLTCLLVTHDPDQAKRLANRVIEFEDGRVVAEGVPEKVLR